jgi:hypothetical protein
MIKRLNAIEDRQELALALADFKDALMADAYTR